MSNEETKAPENTSKPEPGYDSFTLPDGRACRGMRLIKGEHLDKASRIAGNGASQMRFGMAMAAVTVEVAGQWLTLEDILEMPADCALAMVNHAMGKVAGSSAGAT